MTELVVEGLGKRYGDRWAVRDVSLRSGAGLIGLVGPNGAGKTTLMRMLATLLPPTTGRARWGICDSQADGAAIRRVLGYLPQEFGAYPELTARQFLRYLAAMKGLPPALARRRSRMPICSPSARRRAPTREGTRPPRGVALHMPARVGQGDAGAQRSRSARSRPRGDSCAPSTAARFR